MMPERAYLHGCGSWSESPIEGLTKYVRSELVADAERIAWALSHGWLLSRSFIQYVDETHVWQDTDGFHCITVRWDGKGIPPLNDELRQIIDMEREGK